MRAAKFLDNARQHLLPNAAAAMSSPALSEAELLERLRVRYTEKSGNGASGPRGDYRLLP
jgi:hypothetical protein